MSHNYFQVILQYESTCTYIAVMSIYLCLSLNSTVKEEESWLFVSALTAPTDWTVLSLGVSAELGGVCEEESAAGLDFCTVFGDCEGTELDKKINVDTQSFV